MKTKRIFLLLLICVFYQTVHGQKRMLTIDDLARWKYLENVRVSPNGKFITYEVHAEDGEPTGHIYHTSTQKTTSLIPGTHLSLSFNEQWLAYKKSPPKKVKDDLKRKKVKEDKMPPDTLVLYDLTSKTTLKWAGVEKFVIPDSLPEFLIFTTSAPSLDNDTTAANPSKPRNKDNGYHLIIHHQPTGQSDTLFYTKEWQLSQRGPLLLAHTMPRDSSDIEQWLTYHLYTKKRTTVCKGKQKVHQSTLSPEGDHLCMIVDLDTTKSYERNFHLHLAPSDQPVSPGITTTGKNSLPNNFEINPEFEPAFSDNGQRLFFKYRHPPLTMDTLLLEDEIVDVEIWTTDDPYIYPQQNKNLDEKKQEGPLAMMKLPEYSLTLLENSDHPHTLFDEKKKGRYLITFNNEKYLKNLTWEGHDYKDIHMVDLNTGSTWTAIEKMHGDPRLSPSGNWMYWWSYPDTAWMGYDIRQKKLFRWTDNHTTHFYHEPHDYPALPWAHGFMGFSKDEKIAYLYDRFDIWEVNLERHTAPQKLTDGAKSQLRHRWIQTDPDDPCVPEDKLLLHLFSEKNMTSQYGTFDLGQKVLTHPPLEEYYFSPRPLKARNKDIYLFTKENYSTFPDLWIDSILPLEKAQRLTWVNPQQEDFRWGSMEMVHWKVNGKERKGLLAVPEGFDPKNKYPLIVNFYEKSSENLYRYQRPYLHRSTINYPFYNSQGYIIFNPDVDYSIGDPGKSATQTVVSGVENLVSKGFIDQENMALQGHSWGGYQIAHILTQTDIFKCAESGAPVVNMTSAYGGVRWGSGMSRMFQYEKTQSRLGATLWEDPDAYLRNSPLFHMDRMNTPVLILHNDEDGAVPWYQGIEYYMALRRLGKKAWLLNYRGEPHWPVKFQNRKDFQTRMSQFFNHYLKGSKMPEWMKNGIPADERKKNAGY